MLLVQARLALPFFRGSRKSCTWEAPSARKLMIISQSFHFLRNRNNTGALGNCMFYLKQELATFLPAQKHFSLMYNLYCYVFSKNIPIL